MKKTRDKKPDFKKSIKEITSAVIQIGAVGDHDDTDLSNNELLAVHEFGSEKVFIPSRAPITKTVNGNKLRTKLKNDIPQLFAVNFNANTGKFNADNILDGIGLIVRNAVKVTMRAGVSPPLKPAAASAKRQADVPLIKTGQLLNSIEYGVIK